MTQTFTKEPSVLTWDAPHPLFFFGEFADLNLVLGMIGGLALKLGILKFPACLLARTARRCS